MMFAFWICFNCFISFVLPILCILEDGCFTVLSLSSIDCDCLGCVPFEDEA